ncbi:UNVERIFIED_CONTAM: hypothetical protein HDU68_005788, partial [Siphonaria sp. JEL0065]
MQTQIIKHDLGGVESEVQAVLSVFEQKESEDTWIQMDDAIAKFGAVVKGSAHLPGFVQSVRKLKQPILMALNTERTRLSRTSMLLCEILGLSLEERFEGLSDFILPALVRLCTRANKVIVTSANNTLKVIIDHAGVPSLIILLSENICLPSPSKSLRISSAECVNRILGANPVGRLEKYVEALETAIKSGTVDSAPEVRGLIKTTFESYKELFPSRLDRFVVSLSEVAAKYLKVNKFGQVGASNVRKPPPHPRAPTTTSTTSSGPARQPIARASTVTPDNYASTSRGGADEDESETPSFALDLDEVEKVPIKLRTKPFLELSSVTGESGTKGVTRAPPEHVNVSRRLLMTERPSRDGLSAMGAAQHHDHIGGAQRVPRELKATSNSSSINSNTATSSKLKALRVPAAAAAAPAAEQSVKPSADEQSEISQSSSTTRVSTVAQPPVKLENKVKRASIPKPSSRPVTAVAPCVELLDMNAVSTKLKSAEWTVRLAALESISNYIKIATSVSTPTAVINDARAKAVKYCDCLLLGLADNQTKCIMASLTGLLALVESSFAIPEMIDHCIPRVTSIVFYQPQKSKPPVLALGQKLLSTAVEYFGVEPCGLACVHAINNREFGKLLKVRAGCVAMLAELSDEEWTIILSKGTSMKLYMTRLLSQANDTDHTIQKCLKSCLAAMQANSPDAFWNNWASAKLTEKKAVNALFQTSDIAFCKKELEAARVNSILLDSNLSSKSMKTNPAGLSLNAIKASLVTPQKPSRLATPGRHSTSNQKFTPALVAPISASSPLRGADSDEQPATPTISSRLTLLSHRSESVHVTIENETGSSRAGSCEGLSRLAVYEDSDMDDLGEEDGLLVSGNEALATGSPMDSDVQTTPTTYEDAKVEDMSSRLPPPSPSRFSPQRSQSVNSMRTPGVGSRIPIGGSTSKPSNIPMAMTSPKRTLAANSLRFASATGYMGQHAALSNIPEMNRRSSLPTNLGDDVSTTPIANIRPRPVSCKGSHSPPQTSHQKSFSFGAATVIKETTPVEEKNDAFASVVVVNPAIAYAIAGDLEDLWLFAQEKRNLDVVEHHLDQVIDVVLKKAKEEKDIPVRLVKCGIFILYTLIKHFVVDGRASDILLTALLLETKRMEGTDSKLELEYEIDSMLSAFRHTFEAKTLLLSAVRVLETTAVLNNQHCFDMTTFALLEARRIESGGTGDVLFGGDEQLENEYWRQIVHFVVDGLDSR